MTEEKNAKKDNKKEDKVTRGEEDKSVGVGQDELKVLQLKCDEYLAGWQRERADFLNYKKDEIERIGQLIKYANEEMILKLLPVLDNLLLAQIHINDEGLGQVIKQFEDMLFKEGVEIVKTIGEKFDPAMMEAVEGDDEIVSEEVQRGYTMRGKLIRPAKVKLINKSN